ncbi:sensor histidine kinase [Streptomyces sp. NPDC085639]|uniref:sensor histidine kinase n=1 Tax=Streptomyces sp. NPDC085639 TaxID=3365734 RepID=UPI0037CF8A46
MIVPSSPLSVLRSSQSRPASARNDVPSGRGVSIRCPRTGPAAGGEARECGGSVASSSADAAGRAAGRLLSNAARHARSTRVGVILKAGQGEITLTVSDNGRGIPAQGRRSGLRNLADRSEGLGGSFTVDAPEEGGSRLVWRAPLTTGS